jgi:uncharacterized protein (TIGR02996 family)
MDLEAALLQAIHDNPGDDTARLVLCDWLEDHGQAERAELLRLHVALRQQPDSARRPAWEQRLRELLAAGARPCVPTLTNSLGMQFALIPPGKFLMGSPQDEDDRDQDELQHEVEITRPFYLGVHPVTQEQYQRLTGGNPGRRRGRANPAGAPEADPLACPVVHVTWDDAVEFCETLAELPAEAGRGRLYRLPTEAEWEYACRGAGSSSTPFHFGPTATAAQANFSGYEPYGDAPELASPDAVTPVGRYAPNACGLYDMHGNVWEWTADWYDEDYYANSPSRDPQGPARGTDRVFRGGACDMPGRDCRAAYRYCQPPDFQSFGLGLRVVLTLERTPQALAKRSFAAHSVRSSTITIPASTAKRATTSASVSGPALGYSGQVRYATRSSPAASQNRAGRLLARGSTKGASHSTHCGE